MHSVLYFTIYIATILGVIGIVRLTPQSLSSNTAMSLRQLPIWFLVVVVAALVVFEYLCFRVSLPPDHWDFTHAYYLAGKAALDNDHAALRELGNKGAVGFVNLPVVAYLFAPFAVLPPPVATAIFTLLGIGAAVAAWFMLAKAANLDFKQRWLLAFLFLASGPLVHTVKLGNTSQFILCALAGGLLLLRSNRPGLAGVVLGLATVIKPPLVLFGLFFLFRRDWRGLTGYAAVGVVAVLLSLALFGWQDNYNWFQICIVQYSHRWLAAFNVQSIPASLLRLQANIKMDDWASSQLPTATQALIAQGLAALLLVIAAAACLRWPRQNAPLDPRETTERRDLQYCLVICLSLVTSPLTWTHYYTWLLVPTAFFLGGQYRLTSTSQARILGWIAIFLVTPMVGWPWSIQNRLLMSVYQSVIMSRTLIGGIVWLLLLAWSLSQLGGLLTLRKKSS